MEILVNIFSGEIYEFKSDNGVNLLEITKDENEDNKYLIMKTRQEYGSNNGTGK